MFDELEDNSKRYEVFDGEVVISDVGDWRHQKICGNVLSALEKWNRQQHLGDVNFAVGVIFEKDFEEVAPDLIWISSERRKTALEDDGKLHAAPELAVEVVSPGWLNAKRDRETKLKLYSRRGVSEYWIVDCVNRQAEIFRRENAALQFVAALFEPDSLASPLLPGFSCEVKEFFTGIY